MLGVGDFDIEDLTLLEDPLGSAKPKEGRRTLHEKDVQLYAPMSDVGDVMYDKDAVYINIKDNRLNFSDPKDLLPDEEDGELPIVPDGPGEQMVKQLQNYKGSVDSRLGGSELQMFKGAKALRSESYGADDASDEDDEDEGGNNDNDVFERMVAREEVDAEGRVRRRVVFNNDLPAEEQGGVEDEEEDSDDEGDDDDEEEEEGGEKGEEEGGEYAMQEGEDGEGDEDDDDDDGEGDEEEEEEEMTNPWANKTKGATIEEIEAEVEEEGDEEDDGDEFGTEGRGHASRWKEALAEKAALTFKRETTLMELIYGAGAEKTRGGMNGKKKDVPTSASRAQSSMSDKLQMFDDDEGAGKGDDEGSDDDFFTVRAKAAEENVGLTSSDSLKSHARFVVGDERLDKWDDDEVTEQLKTNLFVTGDWVDGEAEENEGDDEDNEDDEDEDEENEEGITVSGLAAKEGETPEEARERRAASKKKLKEKFDQDHDDEKEKVTTHFEDMKEEQHKQDAKNKEEFEGASEQERMQMQGARPGAYVRVQLEGVPKEFLEHFDLRFPVVLGGLLPHEQNLGFVRVRLKKHRWHRKLLKTNNPLVLSVGWRRFQTMPVYSTEDPGTSRQRFLKYTPEHMHCTATFYGPITPPNTGIMGFTNMSNATSGFRTSATGVVIDQDHSTPIVKKLKLTGNPYKIHKNTAFVKGMFNSSLEVAKFEGAQIRTTSGIRGQIKKAEVGKGAPEGSYRATFEDKILMSDIVFCRTWATVTPKDYYNPVTSLLLADRKWTGLRTVAEIRRERNLTVPYNASSEYRPIERTERKFNSLRIPKTLQKDLPFASKPKLLKPRASQKPLLEAKRAVPMDKQEKTAYSLMQKIHTIRNEKEAKRKTANLTRMAKYKKTVEAEAAKHDGTNKKKRKKAVIAREKGQPLKYQRYSDGRKAKT